MQVERYIMLVNSAEVMQQELCILQTTEIGIILP